MDYPLPIDAAGRTILVILCLAFLRLEGAVWLRDLVLGFRVGPPSWLEGCARISPLRLVTCCALALLRVAATLALLCLILAWSMYALIRLADELAAAPVLASLGATLGIVACRVVCPRGP